MKEGSDYSSESDFGEENYQNAEERVFIDFKTYILYSMHIGIRDYWRSCFQSFDYSWQHG